MEQCTPGPPLALVAWACDDAPMPTFHATSVMPCDARTLYDWHARPGAFERLCPPWRRVRVLERRPGVGNPRIGDGTVVRIAIPIGGVTIPWVARHEGHAPGEGFEDRQIAGPLAACHHAHRFVPIHDRASELDDTITYTLPAGRLGSLALGGSIERELERLFWFRHERTRADLERHAGGPEPKTIAIAGSSGMIGSALAGFLSTGGHRVIRLVRGSVETRPIDDIEQRRWDPAGRDLAPQTLADVDVVVNLCGCNVAGGRWTDTRKAELERSRVGPTSLLACAIAALPFSDRPELLINASGVHAYGDGGNEPLTERSDRGEGFLPTLVRKWEAAARPAESAGVRVVHARFGMVLGAGGGALRSLMLPTRLGLAGPIGTGRQWWPWIGLDDAIGALHFIMDRHELSGPVNVCAPDAATANDVASALAEALRRPAVVGLPAGLARAVLGREMADESLLCSTRAEPAALAEHGFQWQRPTLRSAIGWKLGVRRLAGMPGPAPAGGARVRPTP